MISLTYQITTCSENVLYKLTTRNPLYQEDLKNSKGPTSPNNTTKFLFRGPFQSKHTKIIYIPTMVDYEPKHGEHSRDQEQPKNDK